MQQTNMIRSLIAMCLANCFIAKPVETTDVERAEIPQAFFALSFAHFTNNPATTKSPVAVVVPNSDSSTTAETEASVVGKATSDNANSAEAKLTPGTADTSNTVVDTPTSQNANSAEAKSTPETSDIPKMVTEKTASEQAPEDSGDAPRALQETTSI